MSDSALLAPGVKLAQEARSRFVADAGRAMVELVAAVQQRLSALMNETASARDMQNRRDTWTLYQSRRNQWLQGTLKDWQLALKPQAALPKKTLPADFELVGTEEVENKIVASRLVLRVMEKVSAELNDLRARIKRLEASEDLGKSDILRPEVLLLPMIEQWSSVGLPRDAWDLVNDVACQLLTERIHQAYLNANKFLIEQGVLPTIELEDRVKRVSSAPPRASASGSSAVGHATAAAPTDSSRNSGPAGATGQSHPDQAATGASAQRPSAKPVQSGFDNTFQDTRHLTEAAPPGRVHSQAQNVLGQIKRLLGSVGGFDFGVTQHLPMSPALAQALATGAAAPNFYTKNDTVIEDSSAADVEQVALELRRRTTDLKSKATTQGEKATIEIVALMFQAILQEDRIPSGIRVWFARLQMPVLREALADPAFFGSLDHPARLLIDRMGSCVLGFDASGISGSALETEIKRVVQVIEQYPETGRLVYETVYDEFQRFLAQFLAGQASTQRVASIAQQIEEKETLTIQYTIEMRNMFKDLPVRNEIREFLFKVWAEVLAVAAMRQGPQHAQTLAFKKSATDLIWAASAKPGRSDRARVIADLPQLLQQLRTGMTLLGLAPAEQQTHIKTVSDTLADAFLSKTQAIAPQQIAVMAERLAHLEDFANDAGSSDLPLDAHGIEALLGLDATSLEVVAGGGSKPTVAMLGWAQELQLGSWFTLDHNARVDQVQLVWRSERKHLHLLASIAGHNYLMQTRRLAAYLQAGLLLPQEEESLTVRATRDALSKLEANPERLLR